MADDKVSIWNGGLKIGRAPADGELLIGNSAGFTLANITAGSGASVINTPGGIEISATGTGGTVTDVTATSPLASSGGATPDISLDGTVPVANGGSGLTTVGTCGNVLTSDGTAWVSSPISFPVQWTMVVKTSDQDFTTTSFVDDDALKFSVSANKIYAYRGIAFLISANTGGMKNSVSGPASPTYVRIGVDTVTSYETSYGDIVAATSSDGVYRTVPFTGIISNGANAGTVAITWGQDAGPAGTLTVYAGSWLEWMEIG